MAPIRDYHRPSTVEEALDLLARDDVVTAPLGGGTTLNGLPTTVPDEVVDLQLLGLNEITYQDSTLTVGAMARLAELVTHEMTPAAILGLAKREAPNTIRNAATVGGTVGTADSQSPLLARPWQLSVLMVQPSSIWPKCGRTELSLDRDWSSRYRFQLEAMQLGRAPNGLRPTLR